MVACFVFYGIVFLMFGSCASCWKHQAQTQSQNGNRLLIACTQRAYRLWDISLLVYRRQDTIRTTFLTKSFIWVRCVFVGPPPSPHITVSNVCNTWRKICVQARHLCYSWTINPGAWEISCAFFIVHRSRKDQKRVQISDKKRHRNSDDAHWVFTLSGLISGPYYGRYFFLLWFQRHRFQLGGLGQSFTRMKHGHQYISGTIQNSRSIGSCDAHRMDALWDCRVAAHRTRQGSHVKRARCTAISLSLSACPPVCLSIIAGSLPPQPL